MTNHSLDRVRNGQETAITTKASENLVRDDDEFSSRLTQRHRTFLRKLFPTAEDKEVKDFSLRMVKQVADAKVENYRMLLEFQRQAIKEALDQYLEQGKIRSRAERAYFFEAHSRELQGTINESTQRYFEEMERRLSEMDRSTMRGTLKQRMDRMLNQRIDEFENTITTLMSRFASILSEGV